MQFKKLSSFDIFIVGLLSFYFFVMICRHKKLCFCEVFCSCFFLLVNEVLMLSSMHDITQQKKLVGSIVFILFVLSSFFISV